MDFKIYSEQGYGIVFSSREFDGAGMVSHYSVDLAAPTMSGAARVYNGPYGVSPDDLFQSIYREWRGWKGEKSWGSLEGEFDLVAVSDSTGHIAMTARIHTGYGSPSSNMQIEFIIESGQAERLAKQAKAFFNAD